MTERLPAPSGLKARQSAAGGIHVEWEPIKFACDNHLIQVAGLPGLGNGNPVFRHVPPETVHTTLFIDAVEEVHLHLVTRQMHYQASEVAIFKMSNPNPSPKGDDMSDQEPFIKARSKQIARQVAERHLRPQEWEDRTKELTALSLYRIANALEVLVECTGQDDNDAPHAASRYLNIDGSVLTHEAH